MNDWLELPPRAAWEDYGQALTGRMQELEHRVQELEELQGEKLIGNGRISAE